ncbi:hypothetical protein [Streptomyces sp. NPDC054865]
MGTPGTKLTSVQRALAQRDVRDPGVGSTLAALARAGLIEHEEVPRGRGRAVRAKLTRTGRAAVRASLKAPPGRRTGELADWSWEILVRLWKADGAEVRAGGPATERALLDRKPPLATQHAYPWYTITEAGRDHYRQNWARYARLHPLVSAPDPDSGADPWPATAQRAITALERAVEAAYADRREAFHRQRATEADAEKATRQPGKATEPSGEWERLAALQAEQVRVLAARHARARTEMAARHYADADARIGPAIGAFVHGALTAYTVSADNVLFDGAVAEAIARAAAAAGTDRVLPPRPAPCGLHDVDTALGEAWDTAAGVRTRRRPLPTQMTDPAPRRGRYRLVRATPEPPPLEARLERAWALAHATAAQVTNGALRRALHPPTRGSYRSQSARTSSNSRG